MIFLIVAALMLVETAIAYTGWTFSATLWVQPLLLVAFVAVPLGLAYLVDRFDP